MYVSVLSLVTLFSPKNNISTWLGAGGCCADKSVRRVVTLVSHFGFSLSSMHDHITTYQNNAY